MRQTVSPFGHGFRTALRLTAVVAILLAALAAVAAYAIHLERERLAADALDRLERETASLASRYGERATAGRRLLRLLALVDPVRGSDGPACAAALESAGKALAPFAAVARTDGYGRVVCASQGWDSPRDMSAAEHIKEAFRSRRMSHSPLHTWGDGVPVVFYGLPLLEGQNRVVGILHAALDIEWLRADFEQVAAELQARPLALNRQAEALESLTPPESMSLTADHPLLDVVLQKGAGAEEYRSRGGSMMLAGFAPLDAIPGGVFLVLVRTKESATAAAEAAVQPLVAVTGAALAAAAVCLWLLLRPSARRSQGLR